MKLDTSTLPSNGLYTGAQFISINPITYSKLSEYEDAPDSTEVSKLIKEIDYFVAPIEGWRDLLLFDLYPLIFTAKYVSITQKPELTVSFRCSECGEMKTSMSCEELKFTNLTADDLKIKSVNLHGNEFNFNLKTTIGAFYDLLQVLNRWPIKLTCNDIFLMAVLSTETTRNQVYESILHATGDDIALIKYLTSGKIVSNAYVNLKCPKCGKEVVVGIDKLITNIFQFININSDLSQKITYYK